jgi:tripartite ATP-independent transporter DctM subunit
LKTFGKEEKMNPNIILGLIGIGIMITLLMLRMWIAVAMLLVGVVGFAVLRHNFAGAVSMGASVIFDQAVFYTLTTLPVFILMGQILMDSNIGKDLYEAAYAWVGHVRAGLVMATVPTCALFGAITGVPTPAGVTLGKCALPEMRKRGYKDSFSSASIVSAATLAVLIPPSIPMIVYGVITETSVAKLFMAGVLPGILLTVLFMIQIAIMARVNPRLGPPGDRSSWRTRFSSLRLIWPAVILFLLVLGGIYLGYITPTEGGSLGAFGALIIAAFVMRRMPFKLFVHSLLEAVGLTAVILFLICGAQVFARFLAFSGAADWLINSIVGLQLPIAGIMAMLLLMYIILGCLLDIMSAVIITMPIVFPAIEAMGFDPVWFGVVIILIVQMGVITPPVGLDVFVFSGATNVPVGTIFKGVWPYVLTVIICVVILYVFPQIALILPSTMKG